MNHIGSALVLATLLASCVQAQDRVPGCKPLETRQANAAEQRPERPDQTRACAAPASAPFDVVVVAKGLVHPWAVEPLPGAICW